MMFEYFKAFWDWSDRNPERVNTTTAAMYFHFLHIANTLRWKESFGVTAGQTMEALGIGSVKTYRKHFEELIEVGLIEIKKRSINQYSCHVIALPKITHPTTDHVHYHVPNQLPTNDLSNYPSDAPIHKTIKNNKDLQDNKDISVRPEPKPKSFKTWDIDEFNNSIAEHKEKFERPLLIEFQKYWTEPAPSGKMKFQLEKTWDTERRLNRWKSNNFNKKPIKPEQPTTFSRSSLNHYV